MLYDVYVTYIFHSPAYISIFHIFTFWFLPAFIFSDTDSEIMITFTELQSTLVLCRVWNIIPTSIYPDMYIDYLIEDLARIVQSEMLVTLIHYVTSRTELELFSGYEAFSIILHWEYHTLK